MRDLLQCTLDIDIVVLTKRLARGAWLLLAWNCKHTAARSSRNRCDGLKTGDPPKVLVSNRFPFKAGQIWGGCFTKQKHTYYDIPVYDIRNLQDAELRMPAPTNIRSARRRLGVDSERRGFLPSAAASPRAELWAAECHLS